MRWNLSIWQDGRFRRLPEVYHLLGFTPITFRQAVTAISCLQEVARRFIMSRFYRFVPLKGLLRHVIARDRLHVSTLANTLQPPIDGKTAARVFKDTKPLAKTYRIAVLPFLAERVGVNEDALEA